MAVLRHLAKSPAFCHYDLLEVKGGCMGAAHEGFPRPGSGRGAAPSAEIRVSMFPGLWWRVKEGREYEERTRDLLC